MKKGLVFFLGVLTGIFGGGLLLVFCASIFGGDMKREKAPNYFDIELRNKKYVLHTGMPKDSVELMMGAPKDKAYHYNTYSESMEETWKYENGKGQYGIEKILEIKFDNGNLSEVEQM